MGRRPQQPLRPLSAEEQDALERLVKARSGRRDQVQRAAARPAHRSNDHCHVAMSRGARFSTAVPLRINKQ